MTLGVARFLAGLRLVKRRPQPNSEDVPRCIDRLRGPAAGRSLMLVSLGACADEPVAPRIPSFSGPNANLGDIITVTTSSGGKDVIGDTS